MRKIFRVLGRVDDVTEYLLFNVLFATRRRRRLAVTAATFTALLAYLFSGVIVAPDEPLDIRPGIEYSAGRMDPLPPKSWTADEYTTIRQFLDLPHPRTVTAEIRRILDAHRETLDLAVATARRGAVRYPRVPCYRSLRELVNILSCRSLVEAERGETGRSLQTALAGSRIGRSCFDSIGGHSPAAIDLIIGMMSFKAVHWALEPLMSSGRLDADQRRLVAAELRTWTRRMPTLSDILEADLAYLDEHCQGWVRTNRLDSCLSPEWIARLFIPATEEGRAEYARMFHQEVASRIRARIPEVQAMRERPEEAGEYPRNISQVVRTLVAPFNRSVSASLAGEVLADVYGPATIYRLNERLGERQRMLHGLTAALP